MPYPRQKLHELIAQHGLPDPTLSRSQRKRKIDAIVQATGVSQSTIYNYLKRIEEGEPGRRGRSDRGRSRALTDDIQSLARAMVLSTRWRNTPTREIQRELQRSFPDAHIGYTTLHRLRNSILQEAEASGVLAVSDSVIDDRPRLPQKKHQPKPIPKVKRRVPPGLRYQILKRDGFKCVLCGRSPATVFGLELHVDHIIPHSQGGTNAPANLRTTCSECNLGKHDDIE